MPRLTRLEREILATALVEYTAKIPPEYAIAWPHLLMVLAGKLDLTETVKALVKPSKTADKRAANAR
jgi:hypothetical protein